MSETDNTDTESESDYTESESETDNTDTESDDTDPEHDQLLVSGDFSDLTVLRGSSTIALEFTVSGDTYRAQFQDDRCGGGISLNSRELKHCHESDIKSCLLFEDEDQDGCTRDNRN